MEVESALKLIREMICERESLYTELRYMDERHKKMVGELRQQLGSVQASLVQVRRELKESQTEFAHLVCEKVPNDDVLLKITDRMEKLMRMTPANMEVLWRMRTRSKKVRCPGFASMLGDILFDEFKELFPIRRQ